MDSCFKRSRLLAKLPVVLLVVFYAPAASFAQMNGEAARDWAVVFRDTLQQGVLQFWIDHALDKEYGGLLGRLDRAQVEARFASLSSCLSGWGPEFGAHHLRPPAQGSRP